MIEEHPLRAWRKANHVTLEALAEKADIQAPHLSEIETRKKEPSVTVARKLAAETGLSLDEVLRQ
jgi:transcriptional regulator with XRE-family HTH domain